MKTTSSHNPQVLRFSDRVFFVANPSQQIESLFKGPTTASGTFKVRKNGIGLYDTDGYLRVYLVANPKQERYFVSCGKTLLRNGKTRTTYMQALCTLDELWLDLHGSSWTETISLAGRLWTEVTTG